MKKGFAVLLAVIFIFSLSAVGYASAEYESTIIDGRVYPVYDYSSYTIEVDPNTKRAYSETEQARIDAALEKAKLNTMLDEAVQPGEDRVIGMINGKPLYARTEVSTQTTRATTTKSSSTILRYDFGLGGLKNICKVTVKGTFNVSGGIASVTRVDGTYSILDNRCSGEWNDGLRINSSTICQIGFDLYCDGGWGEVTQSAYVDGTDNCYVLIYN